MRETVARGLYGTGMHEAEEMRWFSADVIRFTTLQQLFECNIVSLWWNLKYVTSSEWVQYSLKNLILRSHGGEKVPALQAINR